MGIKIDRTGEKGVNNFGSEMVIVEYRGALDIDVYFPKYDWIFKNADYGYIHLYGHIHEGRDYIPFEKYLDILRSRGIPNRSYNVGCMLQYMNYTPRTLKEIECGYWELKKEKNNGEEKNI